MGEAAYRSLAPVQEWLVPDAQASPAGSAQAFGMVTAGLAPGAQIPGCACGIGVLAVGLAEAGFRVTACDASPAMAGRTRALAALTEPGSRRGYAAGPSCPGQAGRTGSTSCCAPGTGSRTRPGAVAGAPRSKVWRSCRGRGGVLVLTSRNWEQIRPAGGRLDVRDRLVERAARKPVVVYSGPVPPSGETGHRLQICVAALHHGDRLQVMTELLPIWPFGHQQLRADVSAAGLSLTGSTYDTAQPEYLVTTRRHAGLPA